MRSVHVSIDHVCIFHTQLEIDVSQNNLTRQIYRFPDLTEITVHERILIAAIVCKQRNSACERVLIH